MKHIFPTVECGDDRDSHEAEVAVVQHELIGRIPADDLLDEMADHMGHQEDGDRCNKDRQHLLIMGHV